MKHTFQFEAEIQLPYLFDDETKTAPVVLEITFTYDPETRVLAFADAVLDYDADFPGRISPAMAREFGRQFLMTSEGKAQAMDEVRDWE